MISTMPTAKAFSDFILESCPRLGPIVRTSITCNLTGRAPERRRIARFFASSKVRLPGFAARNRFVDDRIRQDLAIQGNGNFMTDIGSRQVSKFLCPFIGEFNGNYVFMALVDLFLCILQIRTGQARCPRFIFKFHDSRFTNRFDSLFRVLFPRQFDDDPACPFFLY